MNVEKLLKGTTYEPQAERLAQILEDFTLATVHNAPVVVRNTGLPGIDLNDVVKVLKEQAAKPQRRLTTKEATHGHSSNNS